MDAQGRPGIVEPMMAVEVKRLKTTWVMCRVTFFSSRHDSGYGRQCAGKVIRAEVPLAEMFGYCDCRCVHRSQGRAHYSMEFKHYTEAPRNVAEAIMNKK